MFYLSQCSTLVRNTVVRATIKVNGKLPILGTRSPKTPGPIDLKFGTRDNVQDLTHTPKPWKSAPGKGWNIMVKCFLFIYVISCAALENKFLGVSPPFLRQTICSGGDWFPRGSQLQDQKFSRPKRPKTWILWPVFGGTIFGQNAL